MLKLAAIFRKNRAYGPGVFLASVGGLALRSLGEGGLSSLRRNLNSGGSVQIALPQPAVIRYQSV